MSEYIIENNAMVRSAAPKFGISKSTRPLVLLF
ncbi:MAG: sporulation transcriptional regulator SpoIIID [Oscillospiraceae bacterium]|nr:sporulation transcriptional regulator SpoIIID [Oscillospiraceae bacterium]